MKEVQTDLFLYHEQDSDCKRIICMDHMKYSILLCPSQSQPNTSPSHTNIHWEFCHFVGRNVFMLSLNTTPLRISKVDVATLVGLVCDSVISWTRDLSCPQNVTCPISFKRKRFFQGSNHGMCPYRLKSELCISRGYAIQGTGHNNRGCV